MNVFETKLGAFSVIGKEGSSVGDAGIAQKLWKDANGHFPEIADLAIRNQDEAIGHTWGLMSDLNHQLLPWEDHFSTGLYLASVEVQANAVAPEGWTKWDIPEREYMVIEIEDGKYMEAFHSGIYFHLYHRRFRLSGAVCDYTDIGTGKNYLYSPVEKTPAEIDPANTTDQIACCGIHCHYCFFSGCGCTGCMNQPNECSFGHYCDAGLCTNIRCAAKKGLNGCYECGELQGCTVGFYQEAPYGRVQAEFIRREGKQAFEAAIKEMVRDGYNYSKDLEEKPEDERLEFLYSFWRKSYGTKGT